MWTNSSPTLTSTLQPYIPQHKTVHKHKPFKNHNQTVTMRPQYLLSFLIVASLCASAFTAAQSDSGANLGGWTNIQEISNPHITEIADFAVTEYNKQSGANLKLVKVIKGQSQVVAGTNYRIVLSANYHEHGTNNYEAIVYERSWESFRDLIFFAPLLQ